MARWLSPGLLGGIFGTYIPSGGGGGGSGPTLPTLTTSGLVLQQRLYANAPTGHLYKDNALTQQAAVGDTILGVKDISGSSHNFADTQSGAGTILFANQMNSKNGLSFSPGSGSLLETRASSYLSTLRSSAHITIFMIAKGISMLSAASYPLSMSRRNDTGGDIDCLFLRLGGGGSYLSGGRMGAQGSSANGGYPLLVFSTDVNAAWADFLNKSVKIVLRACTGTALVQKLDIAGTDGTNAGSRSTTYTNVAADADGGSSAWDFLGYGGTYSGGVPFNYTGMSALEIDLWTGPNQMSDSDVALLMSYGTTQAGF